MRTITHRTLAKPPSSLSRKRAPKMWNRISRKTTKQKDHTSNQKKLQKSMVSQSFHSDSARAAVRGTASTTQSAAPAPSRHRTWRGRWEVSPGVRLHRRIAFRRLLDQVGGGDFQAEGREAAQHRHQLLAVVHPHRERGARPVAEAPRGIRPDVPLVHVSGHGHDGLHGHLSLWGFA